MRGLFLTIEGGEGAGKSTLIRGLAGCFRKAKLSYIETREPGGTPLGRRLRKELLRGEAIEPVTELFLYAADRAHHVSTVIRPALRKGEIVLCDRFSDSTMAYQGYGRRLDHGTIASLNAQAEQGTRPDVTIWLDIPVKTGLERAKTRSHADRLESEAVAFHNRVRSGFRVIAQAEPKRVVKLNAASPPDELLRLAKETLIQRHPKFFHALQ